MNTRKIVLYALFVAITLVLGLSPIGYIPIGVLEITIVHIPVIIGAFVLGIKGGALLGFVFGVTSLGRALMLPTPLSMVLLGTDTGFGWYNLFLIVIIVFVPRILVGVFSALIYGAFEKRGERETQSLEGLEGGALMEAKKRIDRRVILGTGVASLAGSVTNTVFFLGFTFFCAASLLAQSFGTDIAGIATMLFTATGLLNGSIEAALSIIICTAVMRVLKKYMTVDRIGLR